VTSATYSGPAMTIDAHSMIDAHTGMGLVTGTLRSPTVTGQFSAVYDHGVISGTTTGHVGTRPFIASLTATFEPTDGFTRGVIGGRNPVGAAVLDSRCAAPAQRQLRHAQGIVKASNAIEIAVGDLTCVVPPRLAITVTFKYGAGSRVSITCSASNGKETLVSIKGQK
ncbi:MAG TPA: hypothetical protein VGN06_08675, partial [Gaiellaceae bacterium]